MSSVPHQASCVAIGGRGLLIDGPPGSGKSSLALALIDRGATLVGDDGVLLELRGGRLWALPPPNIAGLLEIRNVGLAMLPEADRRYAPKGRVSYRGDLAMLPPELFLAPEELSDHLYTFHDAAAVAHLFQHRL